MTFDARIKNVANLHNELDIDLVGRRDLETVFAAGDRLYIGARSGMHIMTIVDPNDPRHLGTYSHTTSCDPVIVRENIAYITTRSNGRRCGGTQNLLHIVDVTNPSSLVLISQYKLVSPHGLSITNDDLLYVCDGRAGLKILSVSNPHSIKEVNRISVRDGFAYDVLIDDDRELAIVSIRNNFQLYDISDSSSPKKGQALNIRVN